MPSQVPHWAFMRIVDFSHWIIISHYPIQHGTIISTRDKQSLVEWMPSNRCNFPTFKISTIFRYKNNNSDILSVKVKVKWVRIAIIEIENGSYFLWPRKVCNSVIVLNSNNLSSWSREAVNNQFPFVFHLVANTVFLCPCNVLIFLPVCWRKQRRRKRIMHLN